MSVSAFLSVVSDIVRKARKARKAGKLCFSIFEKKKMEKRIGKKILEKKMDETFLKQI